MLPFLLLVSFIVSLVVGIWRTEKAIDCSGWAVLGGIGLVVLCIIWGISYASSLEANGDLSVAQANLGMMSEVAEDINEIAMVQDVAGGGMIGGIENMQQSQKASDALAAYRDKAIAYNELIGRRRAYRNTWMFRYFIAPLPKGVDVFELNIKEVR